MCGRYTLVETEKLAQQFQTINTLDGISPNYNVAPGQIMPVVVASREQGEQNELKFMKWGLIPSWTKDARIGYKMINARAEGIETKPSFRHAFKKQRCIVPANGFFEWQKIGNDKTPKYIHLKQNSLFGFAGLWEFWKQPSGEGLETSTIITTEPNDIMRPIHNRMPVILQPEQEDDWLNPNNEDADFLHILLKSTPSDNLEAYTVSDAVGNVKNNSSELIKEMKAA